MRVQFRESEIWARCVIVEPGRLDCFILSVSLFPVYTNLFIYGVLNVYLENVSFEQHLLKEFVSTVISLL